LYAPIVLNPNLPFQNKNLSVQFDVLNKGTSAFSGAISIDLHGSDGEWIRELGVKSGLNLPSNYHFTNGLTFSLPDGLPDEPGSYQLFVWYQPTGGDWTQIGSGSYSNPLGFQLQVPGLSPDGYEPNNGLSTASPLSLSFSQNTARINTNGTNCHVGNDYDYFRINLPAGYRYELNPRLQDSYSDNNGKTYTLDALFSYSSNGTDWSESFDDVMDGPILLNGPATLYVKVSPYFTGETGTYELDIPITRTLASGLNEEAFSSFKVYPNPAKELLIVEANEGMELDELKIFTLNGQLVLSEISNSTRVELKTTQLASGVYVLQVKTQKGLSTQKIVITP